MSLKLTVLKASVIAISRSSYVRVIIQRKNCLILDQQFSIGENSGE